MTKQQGSSSQPPSNNEPIDFSKAIPTGSLQFIEEPEVKEAEEQIWKSQVIIRCPISPHAYLGHIPYDKENCEELNVLFPCFEKHTPLIFTKRPYDLSFLKSSFGTEPKRDKNEDYIEWLNKVEHRKGQFWKDICIFDLVQLSRQGPKYYNEM